MKKKWLIGFVILFLAAQAFQPSKNRGEASGPADITAAVAVPGDILTLLKRSCYDCHSNNTTYPWFDHITPVNWWVADHIKVGKIELNFTDFARYSPKKQLHKLKEIRETVDNGEMPLRPYLVMHRKARLTGTQKRALVDWTKKAAEEITRRPR